MSNYRGPQHYRSADEQAGRASQMAATEDGAAIVEAINGLTSAVLALTAATALGTADVPSDGDTAAEWRRAICVPVGFSPGGAE